MPALDLGLEDLLCRFGGLGANLRGQLHCQLSFLDRDDGTLGIAEGSGCERLAGAVGALLGLLQ